MAGTTKLSYLSLKRHYQFSCLPGVKERTSLAQKTCQKKTPKNRANKYRIFFSLSLDKESFFCCKQVTQQRARQHWEGRVAAVLEKASWAEDPVRPKHPFPVRMAHCCALTEPTPRSCCSPGVKPGRQAWSWSDHGQLQSAQSRRHHLTAA